ncbi:hypothetical protein PHPALM_28516 [Phytophthora palmivora]|uniref:Uncharacterized protein n=1 Tax=Phytophthora palmivora TaxID=4796 RepID=A0A2P4X9W1_9STRA|nr:hypothetical protein PHPALM_28516 [Phytophthora palmivora]
MNNVEQAWLEAAGKGDINQMKILRQQHPKWLDLNRKVDDTEDTNRTDSFCSWDGFHLSTIGASALHTATWHGDDRIVEYLLEEGQDSNTEDDTGTTPIMLTLTHHILQATRCIFRDRVAIQRNLVTDCRQEDDERTKRTVGQIELFLRFHADVNKRCHRGKTALHHATTDETYEVAKLLISNGASIDAQDEEGKTPLIHCIQSTSLLVADFLLQHGASVHIPDKDGVTPLQLVIRNHDVNMMQIILNHHQCVTTDTGEDFGGSALMTAVDENALPIVKFLLEEKYVTVNHQNTFGETVMHRTLRKQRAGLAEWLRAFDEHSDLLLLRTKFGETCLHYAARYSIPEELRLLLGFYHRRLDEGTVEEEVTALLNIVNSTGSTALFLAATSASLDRDAKTRLMLESGARLLGSNPFLETTPRRSPPTMILSREVHTCLCLWLSELAESHFDAVTIFCMEYLSIIYGLDHPQVKMNHEVLGVMLSSGQAVDMLSLLLLLPFDRRVSLALLEHIGVFGRQQGHWLILALYEELAAAWTGLVA